MIKIFIALIFLYIAIRDAWLFEQTRDHFLIDYCMIFVDFVLIVAALFFLFLGISQQQFLF